MTIVELHPDDLFDKQICGQLSDAERVRLEAHLKGCASCRLERDSRADFFGEIVSDGHFTNLAGIVAVAVNGSASALRPTQPPVTPPAEVARPRRAGSRWGRSLLAAVAALAVLTATVTGWTRVMAALRARLPASVPAGPAAVAPAVPGPMGPFGRPSAGPARSVVPAAPEQVEEAPTGVAPAEAPVAFVEATRAARGVPRGIPTACGTRMEAPAPRAVLTAVAPAAVDRPDAPMTERPDAPVTAVPVVTAGELFAQAGAARRSGDHDGAIALYRELSARFAGSREATLGQAIVAQILLDRGDAPAALGHFNAYLSRGGPLGEDALVGRALSLQRLGQAQEAAKAWAALLSAYPNSVHAARARAQIAALGTP